MNKIYVLSEHPDKEVEQAIHEMSEDKLRIVIYGIARGWKFDEAMDVAVFVGNERTNSWIEST